MEKRDIHGYNKRLDRYIESLNERPNLSERNRQLIRDFAKWCGQETKQRRELTEGRTRKYVGTMLRICEMLSWKDLDKFTVEDIQNLMELVRKGDFTEWTKHDYKVCLRIFFRWLYPNPKNPKAFPELVQDVNIRTKECETMGLKQSDVLTEEEVLRIVKAMPDAFGRAMLFCLYESGARISELANLRIGEVKFEDRNGVGYALIQLFGKTGKRDVPIYASLPALKEWLQVHPTGKPDDYLFVCRNGFYPEIRKILHNAAGFAGIHKPINPHAFRHARATHLAALGWSETQLCQFFGWKVGSDSPAVYIKLTGRNLTDSLLKLNGIEVAEEPTQSKIRPIKCLKCQTFNDPSKNYCSCGYPLTPDAIKTFEEQRLTEQRNLIQEQVKAEIIRMVPALPLNMPLPQLQPYLHSGTQPIIGNKRWNGTMLVDS